MNTKPQIHRVAFWLLLVGALGVFLLEPTVAFAQEDGGGAVDDLGEGDEERPWAEGVSQENQDKAREVFQEANALLMQQFFKQAAATYRRALDYWDHPAIHYNMSLALMNLEQPLELYNALEKSLAHGVPPLLEEANYKRAENYLSLVSQQIAHVVITTEEEGARVTLDGKLLFIGPGAYEGVALAGEHTVAASKPGYLDNNKQVVFSAGQHTRVDMVLFTLDDLTYEKRRFPQWIPWTVTGGGALMLVAGGLLHTTAKSGFESFDTDFDARCTIGCPDSSVPDLTGTLSTATWTQRGAFVAYGIGAAAFTTGVVLIFLNQPKRLRKEGLDVNGGGTGEGVSVVPVLAPGQAGVSASIRF